MNILIIGGTGFLGKHVVEYFVQKNHNKITVLDINDCNVDGVDFIQGNILDKDSMNHAFKNQDVVYSFAGMADIDECIERPTDCINVNVMGTLNILTQCIENKIPKFIFASSMYAGGNHGGFYKTSKKTCEMLIKDFSKYYGLNYVILRYGTLFGTRANNKNSIHRYLRQAVEDGEINYTGDGTELREYVHVDDASRMSYELIDNQYSKTTVAITGKESMTTSDLFSMINEIFEGDIDINYNVQTSVGRVSSHYKITPYTHGRNKVFKLANSFNRELGDALIEIVEEIENEKN